MIDETTKRVYVSPEMVARLVENLKMLAAMDLFDVADEPSIAECLSVARITIEAASVEHGRRTSACGRLSIVPLDEIPPSTPDEKAGREISYRKGYFQGYWQACEDASDYGARARDLHLSKWLHDWRFCGNMAVNEPPPRIGT